MHNSIKSFAFLALGVVLVGLSACSTALESATTGTVAGAAVGAGTGVAIASTTSAGAGTGAIVGGAVGAGVGLVGGLAAYKIKLNRQESRLNQAISDNRDTIVAQEREINAMDQKAMEESQRAEPNEALKSYMYNGPTLGYGYR